MENMQVKGQFIITGGVVSATILSGMMLLMPKASAEAPTVYDSAVITVHSSCSMTGTVNTAHTATIVNGHYETNIGKTTIKTTCNDTNGYAIYAVGFSGDTYGNTVLVSDWGPSRNIVTGTAESGNTSNWAMKISSVSGTYAPTIDNSFSNYHVVPSTYTKVAHFNSITDSGDNAVGSSIETTYSAYISSLQIAGTYTGKVKYTLVHPANRAAPVIPYMQNVSTWADFEIPEEGDEIQAIDNRDGKTYWVTRMKDRSIWMTQNLDLDLVSENGGQAVLGEGFLNKDNTDLNVCYEGIYTSSNGYTCNEGPDGWSDIDYDPLRSTVKNNLSTNWVTNNNFPSSYDPGEKYYFTSGTSSNDTEYSSLSACTQAGHTEAECQHYHVGNYYNWTAAVASNDSSGYTTSGKVAENSICPKGWSLPQSGTGNYSFAKLLYNHEVMSPLNYGGGNNNELYLASGYINIRTNPLYFVRSGLVNNDSLSNAAKYGYYWSSVVNNDANSRDLFFSSTYLHPSGSNHRHYGVSVRCMVPYSAS